MKKILVIVFNKLKHDARVERQLQFLKELDGVTIKVLCFGKGEVDGIDYLVITPKVHPFLKQIRKVFKLITHSYGGLEFKYFGEEKKLIDNISPHDLIVANDIETLPLALELSKRWGNDARIILDAHEFSPEQHPEELRWRILYRPYFYYICNKLLPKVDAMFTVSKGVASLYRENFSVEPVVIPNAVPYVDLDPKPVDGSDIRLVHHGGAIKKRALEKLIMLTKYLDTRFSLHLLLLPTQPTYLNRLKELAKEVAPRRIFFYEPVSTDRVPYFLNQFDVEVVLFDQATENLKNALPNKLFESVQARLMHFTTPYSKDVSEYVSTYGLGILTEGFGVEEAALRLNRLSEEEIWRFKKNVHQKAKELSAEKYKSKFLDIVRSLL